MNPPKKLSEDFYAWARSLPNPDVSVFTAPIDADEELGDVLRHALLPHASAEPARSVGQHQVAPLLSQGTWNETRGRSLVCSDLRTAYRGLPSFTLGASANRRAATGATLWKEAVPVTATATSGARSFTILGAPRVPLFETETASTVDVVSTRT